MISPAKVCPPDSSSLRDTDIEKLGCNRTDSIWPKAQNHSVIHWKKAAVVQLNLDLNPDLRVAQSDSSLCYLWYY